MELDLHSTVAFRALDRKWGKHSNLDTLENFTPAVVDRTTTAVSSKNYFITRKRQNSKSSVKVKVSFCEEVIIYETIKRRSGCETAKLPVDVVTNKDGLRIKQAGYVNEFEDVSADWNIFRVLQDKAKSYIVKKCKRVLLK